MASERYALFNVPMDAKSIQGVPVAGQHPAGGQSLVYDAGRGEYVPSTVTGSGGGGSGAPTDARYLTLATDSALSDERVLTPGTGLRGTDGGAGNAYVLAINDSVVATLSGATFLGPVYAELTGSITRTSAGTPFITTPAGNVVSVTTGSGCQIIISGSHPNLGPYARLDGAAFSGPVTASLGLSASFLQFPSATPNTANIRTDFNATQTLWQAQRASGGGWSNVIHRAGATITLGDTNWWALQLYSWGVELWGAQTGLRFHGTQAAGNPEVGRVVGGQWVFGNAATPALSDAFLFVSGSIGVLSGAARKVAVFGGDSVHSGSVSARGGFSGSLTQLVDGRPFLVGAGSVTITSQSNGQVVISGSSGGSVDLSAYARLAGATFIGAVTASSGLNADHLSVPTTFALGSAPATDGRMRLTNGDLAYARNAADTANFPLVGTNSGDEVLVGTNAGYNEQAHHVRVYGANGVYLGQGNTSALHVGATSVESYRPIVATQLTGSHGLHLSDGALALSGSNSTDGLIRLPWRADDYTVMSAKIDGTAASYPVIRQSGNSMAFGHQGAMVTSFNGYQNYITSTAHTWIYAYGAMRGAFDHEGLGLPGNAKFRVGGNAGDNASDVVSHFTGSVGVESGPNRRVTVFAGDTVHSGSTTGVSADATLQTVSRRRTLTTFGNADEVIDSFVPRDEGGGCIIVVEANFLGAAEDARVGTAKLRESYFYDAPNNDLYSLGDPSGDAGLITGVGWEVYFEPTVYSPTAVNLMVRGNNAETVNWGVDVTYTVMRVPS